jgi:hypothetical protein
MTASWRGWLRARPYRPRQQVRSSSRLVPVWLEERRDTVAQKTYVADAALPRLMPTALAPLCRSEQSQIGR